MKDPRTLFLVFSLAATSLFAQDTPVKHLPPTGDAAPLVRAVAGTEPNQLAVGNDARLVNAPRVVASLAALRALPPPPSGVESGLVIVQGYYAPGDGGGGQFRWDPAANGSITQIRACSIYQLGTGYPREGVAITLSPPDQPGGTPAKVTCGVHPPSGGVYNYNGVADGTGGLYNFVVTDPGSGYLHEPTVTLSADAPSVWQRAILHPYSPDFDDGGYTLASSVSTRGRWRRVVAEDTGIVDARCFGLVLGDESQADANSARLTRAMEALPLYKFGSNGIARIGQVQCEGLTLARQGILRLPQGDFYIGDTLGITPGMTLSAGGGLSRLIAKTGFAPAGGPAKRMLKIFKNGLYGAYDRNPYPGPPFFSYVDTYEAGIVGHLDLLGQLGRNNASVQGAELLGAQGCAVRGEVSCNECGPGGQIVTSINADTLTVLGGAAPGVVLLGAVNNYYGRVDTEHVSRADTLDADGDPVPACLILNGSSNRIETLCGETNALACKIDGSPGSSIGSYCGNVDTAGIIIQNAAAGVHVDGLLPLNVAPGGTFALLDRSPDVIYSGLTHGQPLTVPFGGATSYRFGHAEQGPLAAPYLSGDVAVAGLLSSTALPTAKTLPGWINPMPAHTGRATRGNNVASDTEYTARESLHFGTDANPQAFTALRASPSRGPERVFGRRDGGGVETEDAVLNAGGLTLKNGAFHGDGSGLVNLPAASMQTLTPAALPAPSAAYNGRLWYDGTHFWGCDGVAWKQLDH